MSIALAGRRPSSATGVLRSLRQEIANGRLTAHKVGRDWHVRPSEVERYRRESLRRG